MSDAFLFVLVIAVIAFAIIAVSHASFISQGACIAIGDMGYAVRVHGGCQVYVDGTWTDYTDFIETHEIQEQSDE